MSEMHKWAAAEINADGSWMTRSYENEASADRAVKNHVRCPERCGVKPIVRTIKVPDGFPTEKPGIPVFRVGDRAQKNMPDFPIRHKRVGTVTEVRCNAQMRMDDGTIQPCWLCCMRHAVSDEIDVPNEYGKDDDNYWLVYAGPDGDKRFGPYHERLSVVRLDRTIAIVMPNELRIEVVELPSNKYDITDQFVWQLPMRADR